ncbi:hypothetical protein FBB35_13680 [Nostoc sp. TCL240-02]|nr:hypothetical protein FBB35_13680 [Nostoc sp. TCL240-02]
MERVSFLRGIIWGLGIGDWGLGTGDWGLGIRNWALGKIINSSFSHFPHLPHIPMPHATCPMPNSIMKECFGGVYCIFWYGSFTFQAINSPIKILEVI